MRILSEKYRFAQGVLNKISGGKKGLESMLNKSEASELPACILDPAQAQLEQATLQTCIMILQLPLPLAIAVFRFLCFCDSGFPLPICCNSVFRFPYVPIAVFRFPVPMWKIMMMIMTTMTMMMISMVIMMIMMMLAMMMLLMVILVILYANEKPCLEWCLVLSNVS